MEPSGALGRRSPLRRKALERDAGARENTAETEALDAPKGHACVNSGKVRDFAFAARDVEKTYRKCHAHGVCAGDDVHECTASTAWAGEDFRWSRWARRRGDRYERIGHDREACTSTHVVTLGSAWADFGAFYNSITAGSTKDKIVLGPTPTWIAVPHISEESTRKKERDPVRHAREYASIATGASSEGYSANLVEPCVGKYASLTARTARTEARELA